MDELGLARKWRVGELESVLFDVRLAGGDDRTELDFRRDRAVAAVPYPEAVAVDRRAAAAPPPAPPEPWWRKPSLLVNLWHGLAPAAMIGGAFYAIGKALG